MADTLVQVDALHKNFGLKKAVDGVSFTVARGEVLGFLGPNGAGKSTTMKMIAGFLRPDSGRVSLGGVEVAADPMTTRRTLGYVPEGAPLYGEMAVLDFLRFVGALRGLEGAPLNNALASTTEKLQLRTVLGEKIEVLSKGFKRRVALAQALLHDPEILVLDEPTDGLDPNQKHHIRALVKEMAPNKAIIISTHILEEVDAVCSRAIILHEGRVVLDSPVRDLKHDDQGRLDTLFREKTAGAAA